MTTRPSGVLSASAASSVVKTKTSSAMSPAVTRGRRRIRRSKSTRRESSMSGVMRSGISLTSAALTGVEHHAEGERDASIQSLLVIAAEVEDVPVENGELPIELAEHDAGAAVVEIHQQEVRPEQAEQRAEDTTQ